jgi:hypothetical protein
LRSAAAFFFLLRLQNLSFPKSILNAQPKSVASVGLAGADFAFPKGEGFGKNVLPLNPTCGLVDGRLRRKWSTGTSSLRVGLPLPK